MELNERSDIDGRRCGRLRTEYITCRLGKIVDLSATGMRVVVRGRCTVAVDEQIDLNLEYGGQSFRVTCTARHITRVGIGKHAIGFQFNDLDESSRQMLTHVARSCTDSRVFM